MELVLIRGLPGSGKSTMAREQFPSHEHYEADMFFIVNGDYLFDQLKIREAHEWCQRKTLEALEAGRDVVVTNTFTRRFELDPYLEMGRSFGIEPMVLVATGAWQSVHGVPVSVTESMKERWEEI